MPLGELVGVKKFKIVLASALISLIIISAIYYHRKKNTTPATGWKTSKPADNAFKPGIIVNNRPPAAFEISLIEPDSHSSIKMQPEEIRRVLVSVKMLDTNSENSSIPPTFVNLKLSKGGKYSDDDLGDRLSEKTGGKSDSRIMVTGTLIGKNVSSSKSTKAAKHAFVDFVMLKPHEHHDYEYIYSGNIKAPETPGDYAVVLEAQYSILNDDAKSPTMQQFQKTVQGATLHVTK